ncbi:MAG: UDP-N-acetylmuramate dehydrogenase [Proteobacteria bacterium]|nr:UDP-N-acetylmuramate dehydrogenase [Pseudomonadota bacterium]
MRSEALRTELRALLGRRVAFDEPLSRHTSLRVGGPADALARIDSREELLRIQHWCRDRGVGCWVVGSGFNTLAREEGVRGLVLRLSGLRRVERLDGGSLRAEAGATHTQVIRFCEQAALTGLEFGAGIPGTVGGWVAMNAGIREREMGDVLHAVEYAEPSGEGCFALAREELSFEYRCTHLPDGAVVVAATFETRPGEPERIRAATRAQLEQRRASQPVDRLSCGSVFKNPPGDHAGRLIEAANLKGLRVGGAEVSEVHANFFVNRGEATADDVLELIGHVRERVLQHAGLCLETEVRVLGGAT